MGCSAIDETAETFVNVFQKGYRKDLGGFAEIIWRSERDGWNHLYLYDGHTGKVKNQITIKVYSIYHLPYVSLSKSFTAVRNLPQG